MKYSTLLFFTLIAFLFSCQVETTESTETTTTETAKATFVANPKAVPKQEVKTLEIGASAPDFNLPSVDGDYHSLDEYRDAKILVVIFTCNHCPTAQAYERRMIDFTKDYKDKGVQVVAISPNSPLGLLYEELGYSDLNDDFEDMQLRAEHLEYNFPYLYDGDTHEASLQYGPVATPHAFVFDAERKLQYVGRLDKVEKPGGANADDLRAAVDALLEDKLPEVATTKTFGCSTKWAWKTEYKDKVEKDWAEKEVTLEQLDEAGIQELIANEDSEKLRLINVWATWCGPCIIEYPDFITLQRMYGARDFEFISISADKAAQQEKALQFLQKENSAVKNYLFDNDDKYALIEAIDEDWNGALPYTMLIEPNGNVVWKHQGSVDFLELKRAIVDHPMIGRYF
ncbi:MAG: redoxin domain-containing protein [Bacteroidota bacterium]